MKWKCIYSDELNKLAHCYLYAENWIKASMSFRIEHPNRNLIYAKPVKNDY